MSLTPLDVLMVLIIVFFLVLGVYRGLFREIMSLVGYIAGVYLAAHYYSPLAKWALRWFPSFPSLVYIFSFFIILVGVVLLTGILGVIFRKLVIIGDLRITDRILGGIFGLIKAFLINAFIVIILVSFVPWGREMVKKSPVARGTQTLTKAALQLAPSELKNKFLTEWRRLLGG